MKKLIIISLFFAGLILSGCAITTETTSTDTIDHNPDPTFSDLNNYGTWVNIPDYGSVWKPYADDNWQPYSDGQWDWTEQGWMWDSNEPFGWIVYHYGYWQFTDYDGWFWVPGYDWAPARVMWYNSGGYIGWAPIPPPNIGVSLIYNDRYTRKIWVVVRENNFAGQNARKYRDKTFVPGGSALRSNDGGRGPNKSDIERISNRTINVVQPTREQINKGNHLLTKVKMQNNTPVNPVTIRNQSNPVRTSTDVNPQKPASNPPEINDRRPVNSPVQKQPEEKPVIQPNNPVNTQEIKTQNNTVSNNTNQKKSGKHKSGHKKNGVNKQQTTTPAPVRNPAPTQAPMKVNNSNSGQKNGKR